MGGEKGVFDGLSLMPAMFTFVTTATAPAWPLLPPHCPHLITSYAPPRRGGAAGNQGNHVGSRVDAKGAGSGAGRGSPLMVTESLSGISERVVDVYQ